MNFPVQGHWWLPGSPDKSVFGTLTFTRRGGAVLALADSLPGDEWDVDIIVGQTSGGAHVTLLHAIRTQAPMFRLTQSFPCSYHAPFLLAGAHFDREADMRFTLWQIRFPQLKPWAGINNFEIEQSEVWEGRDCPEVQIAYRTPMKQTLLSGADGMSVKLGFWPLVRSNPYFAAVRQDVHLEIELGGHDTLQDYMQAATRFEYFLTLATGSLVRNSPIKALIRAGNTETDHSPILVDILYQPVRNPPRQDLPYPHELLFSLKEIAGREQECFQNWYTKSEWLDPVCALYFGTLYNPSKYLNFDFLALVQALEAYHRRASAETEKPAAEHDARVKAILDAVPAEQRGWLARKLIYSNELSLRRRLKMLFARFSFLLDDLIPDQKALISAIYDNRNYLTHYDAALRRRAASGAKLLLLVEVLKLLLQACLLMELGLPNATIHVFLSRSRTVRMVQHLNRQASTSGS